MLPSRSTGATGQLMVADGRKLNFDSTTVTAEKSNANNNTYVVQVTAHDSSGAETAPVAMVTITVFDVDEKPAFGPMDAAADAPANITGAMHTENTAGADGEFDLDIATYTATDPEGENVTLSLMGNDAGLFELAADTETENNVSQVLSFKKNPDFEMPGDRNQDNVYEVTVRASDGTLNADRMVNVKVINVDEPRKGNNISGGRGCRG